MEAIVVIIVVFAALILLKRFLPYKPPEAQNVTPYWGDEGQNSQRQWRIDDAGEHIQRLNRKYQNWFYISALLIAVYVALFSFGWYFLLSGMALSHLRSISHTDLLIMPTRGAWIASAFLLGVLTCYIPQELTLKGLLRERYDEYIYYEKISVGINTDKLLKPLLSLWAIVALLVTVCSWDSYIYFSDSQIVVNRFASFGERRFAYDRISALTTASHRKVIRGKPQRLKQFIISFTDGGKLNISNDLFEWGFHPSREEKIMAHVSRESGILIQHRKAPD